MNEEDALLRAICDHPDDDTPRLVFADWLDEQGGEINTAWAELIRDQIRLSPEIRTSFIDHDDDWLKSWSDRLYFPPTLSFYGWKRGFPTRLHSPVGDLCATWDSVIRRIPVEELYLEEAADVSMKALVASCDLRSVRELFIHSVEPRGDEPQLTDRAIVALAGCPALSDLKSMLVRWVSLTDDGIDAVLHSHSLAHLKELHIGRHQSSAATFGACERLRARFGSKVIS